MRRLFLTLIAALACLTAPAAGQTLSCQMVQLDPGFTIGDLKGTAPADGAICYQLSFAKGQNISLEVVSGKNVAVTVPGKYEARSDRMFLGDLPGGVEVRVFQLMRAPAPQPFTLRVRFEPPGNG